jgi:hypothetical protein
MANRHSGQEKRKYGVPKEIIVDGFSQGRPAIGGTWRPIAGTRSVPLTGAVLFAKSSFPLIYLFVDDTF